jgi:hypothetical protein
MLPTSIRAVILLRKRAEAHRQGAGKTRCQRR